MWQADGRSERGLVGDRWSSGGQRKGQAGQCQPKSRCHARRDGFPPLVAWLTTSPGHLLHYPACWAWNPAAGEKRHHKIHYIRSNDYLAPTNACRSRS
jgi:hypothetical protein